MKQPTTRCESFNGAAVSQRRKPEDRGFDIRASRFASMGPPSLNGGNRDAVRLERGETWVLQWGRRLSTAETKFWRIYSDSRTMLQWGRRLSTAETMRQNFSASL